MATLPIMSLSDITTACQQRCDMVNSTFVSGAEWTSYINQGLYSWYDLLVEKTDGNYFIAPSYTITTDGTNDHYDLPGYGSASGTSPAFYKLKGVDLLLAGTPNSSVTIRRFNWAERNRFSIPNVQTLWGLTNLMYQLVGNTQIWFIPLPAASQSIRIWYVPQLAPLVNQSDTVNGVSGWLEYVILFASIRALTKEESDTSAYERQLAIETQRMLDAVSGRDQGAPPTVADNAFSSWGWPFGSGGGADGGGW